jgi:hypothetical protein
LGKKIPTPATLPTAHSSAAIYWAITDPAIFSLLSPSCRRSLTPFLALTEEIENLLGHSQPQGQIRKRAAHTAPEVLNFNTNQTPTQITTETKAVLVVLNLF